jgi:acetyl-CoA carboxylase carboxyl transferase subunit beta
MSIFQKRPISSPQKKRDMPEGLWEKCPRCGEVVHKLALEENQQVCPKCDYHFRQNARDRIKALIDAGTFEEMDATMTSRDVLDFKTSPPYAERLKTHRTKSGGHDAVITGIGEIEGRKVILAVMDFGFMGGSMGSVVGEKITRAVERATAERLAVIVVSASGGARMYEGLLSLMQMAKTCAALSRHSDSGLPYISIMTDPTTGGVSASFATIGDVNIAEPNAMIGFAGPRVVRETTHQDLPEGFQTAEFLEEHGLVDMIVPRKRMRALLSDLLRYLTVPEKEKAAAKTPAQ